MHVWHALTQLHLAAVDTARVLDRLFNNPAHKEGMRTVVRPWLTRSNTGAPVSSSNAVTPSDHASCAGRASMLLRRRRHAAAMSGDAYARVKLRGAASPARATQPNVNYKSMTIQRFCRSSHMMLAGLMSRCT